MTDDWRVDRIGSALQGQNPTVMRRLESAFAVIGDVQFLPGYSVLLVDNCMFNGFPTCPGPSGCRFCPTWTDSEKRLNARAGSWTPVSAASTWRVWDTDPFLHAHVWPRFEWEPAELVGRPVWLCPRERWHDERFRLGPQHDVLRDVIGGELDRLRLTS